MQPGYPLARTLLGSKYHHFAELPYNLNWMIRLRRDEQAFLTAHPIVVTDVGCRGEAPKELLTLFPYMDYHAFDADATECARLNGTPHPYANRRLFPLFIGDGPGEVTFNLFHNPGESSSFDPGHRFQELYAGEGFGISRQVRLETTNLDEHYQGGKHPTPDLIKLDTQGSELGILQGAGSLLQSVSMVEVEVEFVEMYAGQARFDKIFTYLVDQGFELLYLNRCFGQKEQVYRGPSRGQLLFGDALFGRREDRLQGLSPEQICKYALLLINYGHMDLAFDLIQRNPFIAGQMPGIVDRFKGGRAPRLLRQLSNRLDQILVYLLHLRTFNHLTWDSDRSWPVR
jgi:FkbM family methyltransferase